VTGTCPAGRKHGTNAGYRDGGKDCPGCCNAARIYNNRRRRARAYGQWDPWVDAEPIRAHVNNLRASGMGVKRIVEQSGVAYTVVQRLVWPIQGAELTQKMRPRNAAALLAVTVNLAPSQRVDSTGTRRRIEALMAIGWSQAAIAREAGLCATNRTGELCQQAVVEYATAQKLRATYDRLSMTPPPERTTGEKGSATRARRYAQRHGYAPPLAWDDDDIDDPTAAPYTPGRRRATDVDPVAVREAAAGRPMKLNAAEKRAVIAVLAGRGFTPSQIAERLGIARSTADQALQRHRRAA
jgi:hypothetical protein